MQLTGLLLAAGGSQRFGTDKRLVALPGVDNLIVHSARGLRAALEDVVVVLRPEDTQLSEAVGNLGCRVCQNPTPNEGMASSIRCGVRASIRSDGWLIVPADLPLLRASSIGQVALRLHSADAVVPICHGRRGHPVGFSGLFRDALLNLSGDRGARDILRKAHGRLVWLNLHDPGIYRDIDRPEDLEPIRRNLQAGSLTSGK